MILRTMLMRATIAHAKKNVIEGLITRDNDIQSIDQGMNLSSSGLEPGTPSWQDAYHWTPPPLLLGEPLTVVE